MHHIRHKSKTDVLSKVLGEGKDVCKTRELGNFT